MKCVCCGVRGLEEERIESEYFPAASFRVGNAHAEEFDGESIVSVGCWTEQLSHL